MQQSLIKLIRVLPIWFMYGIMALVIPFYIAFNHRGRHASWQYYRQRIGWPALRSAAGVYLNMFNLGMVVLDRFAEYAGKKFNIDFEAEPLFKTLCSEQDGFVILSSHVGNHEMAGYNLHSPKRMNVLVYAGETETVMANRDRLFQDTNVSMIRVAEDMSHLYLMSNALSRGEIVSLPADRVFGSPKTYSCKFLGATAAFPAGPFKLAMSRGSKVLVIFCMKTGLRSYKTVAKTISADNAPALAQAFATEVESVVRTWPHQWYNFYDFWA